VTARKYANVPTTVDGVTFDSRLEARRYAELRLMEQAGAIRALRVHPRYELIPAFVDGQGKRHRATFYEADFDYLDGDNRVVVEDTKGGTATMTAVFRIKAKLFQHRYRSHELRIVTKEMVG
jgi:hypothetical protein